MNPLDALWHLLNFAAPAVGVGVISTALAKLMWRRELAAEPYIALVWWPVFAGLAVLVVGLLVSGRDGRIWTYVALVIAAAGALWWKGLRRVP